MAKIGIISLGCDKNRVDSENVIYTLTETGHEWTQEISEADVLIVNTCAFIDSAKKESIDTILELATRKKDGAKLLVLGCLAERYAEELVEALPEVDTFVGINAYHEIERLVSTNAEKVVKYKKYVPYERGRVITTPGHYAYLKIADGCDNFCSYCAIPLIRGRYRSYPMEELVEEARDLEMQGVKELILVAQDTTRYGIDIYGRYALKELLRELIKIDFEKIRIMYAYPELIDDELIRMISTEDKIAKYIDVPMQHASSEVLKLMHRRTTGEEIRALVARIRDIDPDIAIRSSFIVGFPGETEEQFEELEEFIGLGNVDYAGFFTYSKEEGTLASKMKGQILQKVKKEREKRLSKLQCAVVINNHQKYLNKVVKVIYEGIDYNKNKFYGRIEQNAPDIDTKVFFTSSFPLDIGEYYDVEITKADFNLYGKTIEG